MLPSAQADGQGQSSALPLPVRFPIVRAFTGCQWSQTPAERWRCRKAQV